jgi:hypothetical protein
MRTTDKLKNNERIIGWVDDPKKEKKFYFRANPDMGNGRPLLGVRRGPGRVRRFCSLLPINPVDYIIIRL